MPDEIPAAPANEQQLDDVLAQYIASEEAGRLLDRQELLVRHPQFAGDLREFFANRDQMQRLAEPLRGNGVPGHARGPVDKLRYFGDYELLEEVAVGGMGIVYRARQVSLNRIVAVKMILKGTLASEEDVKRFQAEAEAAASLQHPAIVAIHEVGLHEGQHYFSMDFVEGYSLAELPRDQPLSARQAAEYVRDAAEAVHYAHQKGTLHRDIKPSNILIDRQGRVRITDFGLAKRIEGNSELTLTGQILGTPSYMPPEQASGKRSIISAASDIYSLGAVLYELLAGRPPFRGESPVETLRQVESLDPISPRLLSPTVPRDLETICLKCLEKEPHKRYGSAELFADDLGRYLRGEAVLAQAPSIVYRFVKFARRHKGPVVSALATMLVLVAGVIGTTWGMVRAERARRAEVARAEGERAAKLDAQKARQAEAQRSEGERLAKQTAEKRLVQIERGLDLLASIFKDLNPKAEQTEGKPLRFVLGERLDQATKELQGDAVGDPLAVARLQLMLAESQLGLGYSDKAITLATKAQATYWTTLGPDHSNTLNSMNTLGDAYRLAGRLDLALPLLEETLKVRKAKLDLAHPDTLNSMNNLALGYQAIGKFDLALPLYEETLKLMQAKFGPERPSTLNTMNNLADAYREAGKLDLAVPFLEETLRLNKATLGAKHVQTLTSMNNLGNGYRAAGKLDLAMPLLEETLKVNRATLGSDHPNTLTSMNNLALGHQTTGKFDLALPLYEETLKLMKAKLGTDHRNTLNTMDNLGDAYIHNGKLDLALPLLEEALQVSRRALGPAHLQTLAIMNTLGDAYRYANRLDSALPLLQKALKLRKAKLGLDHPDTFNSMNNVALGYQAIGNFDLALPLYEETLKLMQAKLGTEHPSTLNTMKNLAGAYRAAGKFDLALALYEQTVMPMTTDVLMPPRPGASNLGTDHQTDAEAQPQMAVQVETATSQNRIAKTLNNSATALKNEGDLGRAIAQWHDMIRLNPADASLRTSLGFSLRAKGDLDGALAQFQEALRLDPTYPWAHNNLGLSLRDKGDLDGAIAEYRVSIHLNPNINNTHNNLGLALEAKGDLDAAMLEYREEIRINPTSAWPHNNLGYLLKRQGDLDAAMIEFREAIRLDPKLAKPHSNLGVALKEKGDLDGAIAEYREAIRIDPKYAMAHTNLGDALRKKDDRAGAIAAYRKGLGVATEFAAAEAALKSILAEDSDAKSPEKAPGPDK